MLHIDPITQKLIDVENSKDDLMTKMIKIDQIISKTTNSALTESAVNKYHELNKQLIHSFVSTINDITLATFSSMTDGEINQLDPKNSKTIYFKCVQQANHVTYIYARMLAQCTTADTRNLMVERIVQIAKISLQFSDANLAINTTTFLNRIEPEKMFLSEDSSSFLKMVTTYNFWHNYFNHCLEKQIPIVPNIAKVLGLVASYNQGEDKKKILSYIDQAKVLKELSLKRKNVVEKTLIDAGLHSRISVALIHDVVLISLISTNPAAIMKEVAVRTVNYKKMYDEAGEDAKRSYVKEGKLDPDTIANEVMTEYLDIYLNDTVNEFKSKKNYSEIVKCLNAKGIISTDIEVAEVYLKTNEQQTAKTKQDRVTLQSMRNNIKSKSSSELQILTSKKETTKESSERIKKLTYDLQKAEKDELIEKQLVEKEKTEYAKFDDLRSSLMKAQQKGEDVIMGKGKEFEQPRKSSRAKTLMFSGSSPAKPKESLARKDSVKRLSYQDTNVNSEQDAIKIESNSDKKESSRSSLELSLMSTPKLVRADTLKELDNTDKQNQKKLTKNTKSQSQYN